MAGRAYSKQERSERALQDTDAMPSELRMCVHEFGYAIVNAMRQAGVTKPGVIRQLVHECWQGPRQPLQNQHRSAGSSALNNLDWLMLQCKAGISAATLIRVLRQNSLIVIQIEPTQQMVEASMHFTEGRGILTKSAKHKGRLRAALDVAVKQQWPHLADLS